MKKTTKDAFIAMKNKFGTDPFDIKDIFGICETTFLRWHKDMGVKPVVIKTGWSLTDTVDLLNSCAGDDCYSADWHFIVEDGKVFKVDDKYQFV